MLTFLAPLAFAFHSASGLEAVLLLWLLNPDLMPAAQQYLPSVELLASSGISIPSYLDGAGQLRPSSGADESVSS